MSMRSTYRVTPSHDAWRGPSRLIAACVAASALLITACGGGGPEAAQPTTAATAVAKATIAATASPAPSAPASAAASARPINPAAPVVIVEANDNGTDQLTFKSDTIAVPAGDVTITLKNLSAKMNHELFIYPVQDVTKLMALKRAGQSATETEFLKDLAGMTGSIAPGTSKQIAVTLSPGFYEIACFARMKNADGSTAYVHFDKGQTLTLAAFGPGGPAASIATPSSTIAVQMKDGAYGSWILQPDHLVASAGKVTVSVTNNMKINHDFVVYPLGDVSADIAKGLKSGEDIDLDEAQPVAEDLEPGKTGSVTLTLTPGAYAMACFMVSKASDGSTYVHRDMGQRIVFWVK